MPINTLFIVAGSRGAGKSTFMDNCDSLIPSDQQPAVLQPLFSKTPPLVYLMELQAAGAQQLVDLRLHMDIFTPFQEIPPCTEANLANQLTSDQFRAYEPVAQIIAARTVYILTLRLPRQVVLRRWLNRVIQEESRRCRTTLAHIYSDASGDRLYNGLYNAWDEFVQTLNPAGIWDIEENGNQHTLKSRL